MLEANEVDDAGYVREELGVHGGGETAEDVVEDGGGMCVIRVATSRVEQAESGAQILLRFEELQQPLGVQVMG